MMIVIMIGDTMKENTNIKMIIGGRKEKLQILILIGKRDIDIRTIKIVYKVGEEEIIQDMRKVIGILTMQIEQEGIENRDSQVQLILTENTDKVNTKEIPKEIIEKKYQGIHLTLIGIMFLLKGGMILQTVKQMKEKGLV